jgi:hypothetical protein
LSRLHKLEDVVLGAKEGRRASSTEEVQQDAKLASGGPAVPPMTRPKNILSTNDAEWLERENVDQSSTVSTSSRARRMHGIEELNLERRVDESALPSAQGLSIGLPAGDLQFSVGRQSLFAPIRAGMSILLSSLGSSS